MLARLIAWIKKLIKVARMFFSLKKPTRRRYSFVSLLHMDSYSWTRIQRAIAKRRRRHERNLSWVAAGGMNARAENDLPLYAMPESSGRLQSAVEL